MAGQPTKCTPERIELMSQAIRAGLPIRQACSLSGFGADSHYAWLQRAAEGKKPYVDYLEAVERASADFVHECLQNIAAAAFNGQWTAAAWLLERKFPQDFAKLERSDVTMRGPGPGGEHVVEHRGEALDELIGRLDSLAARRREAGGPSQPDE